MREYTSERCSQIGIRTTFELYKLAEEYHRRCEDYDILVCSGKFKDGIAKPVDGRELCLVNKNAKIVFDSISPRVLALGYALKDFRKAISSLDFALLA